MELSKSKIGRYARLRHKKWRDREGLFIAQGRKVVEDTLPYFDTEALIEDTEAIRKISTLENVPDVIAIYRIPERKCVDLRVGEGFWPVLDGVQDPGNLGTIIRTAHWFGVEKIFCSRDTVDVYNPKVVMSTMGSIAKVEVVYCDLEELLETNPGLPAYGLLLDGEDIFRQKNLRPGFILMGSEGHGLSERMRSHITKGLTIPPSDPSDHPDSLNVAVATAITLSQILK